VDRSGQTLLDKYLLSRRIGKGGMGEVWEAEHALTGRRVAVKILGHAHLGNAKIVARFGREARAASAVHHPGIVEILDQDVTPAGEPFLVMEFLEGESLGERIKRKGKLGEEELVAIAVPLLDALHVAHLAGVVHRDLKPDNVFVVPRERGREQVKILDFGISRKADELSHHLTQEGSVLGTPHYMSPEQARGEVDVDGRADVYAMGVLLYEAATGHVPFDAKNYNALLQRILGEAPASPRSRGAEIGPALERVILSALAKSRAARPQGADALRDALREAAREDAAEALLGAAGARSEQWGVRLGGEGMRRAADPLTLAAEPRTLAVEAVTRATDYGGRVSRAVTVAREEFDHALAPLHESEARAVLPLGTSGERHVSQPPGPLSLSGVEPLSGSAELCARPPEPRPRSVAPPPAQPASVAPRVDVERVGTPFAARTAVLGGNAAVRALRSQPDVARHAERESGAAMRVARGAFGWLLAAAAIALLAYTGRLVFRRPDLHRAPAAAPAAAETAPPSTP
jgi:tRNA A-37 threonylcarbamoyl transferase component Bud32